MGSICQRCSEEGEDRRTLYMACFYDMSESAVPFAITCPPEEGTEFYTLLVCKRCCTHWMQAIQSWFQTKPGPTERVDSGHFVRGLSVTVEKKVPK